MKKKFLLLILIMSVFTFNSKVFAASVTLSVSSSSVSVGDTFTVYANMNSAAAWNIKVSSTGPVSGCTINQADATSDALDTSKSFSATCSATSEGTITITLSGDVTSATNGTAVIISGTTSVNVTKKVAPTPTPVPTPTPPANNNNNRNNPVVDNRSKNANLKELKIEGHELTKIDDNNYELVVKNNITNLTINATVEDEKASVTGTGEKNLEIGENIVEIIVTSESGIENKINIRITRKEGYYLDDLDTVLNDKDIKDINIIINSDTKITKEDLNNIKKSKKEVVFNFFDDSKKLLYSWTISGNKMKDINEFSTLVNFNSKYLKEISKVSNYADGLYVHFDHSGSLSTGTKIKLYVGNKFENGRLVNVYYYNTNDKKLESIKKELIVKEGYVEFDIDHCSDYFVTMSDITSATPIKKTNIFLIISIIELIIIIVLIILCFLQINPISKLKGIIKKYKN